MGIKLTCKRVLVKRIFLDAVHRGLICWEMNAFRTHVYLVTRVSLTICSRKFGGVKLHTRSGEDVSGNHRITSTSASLYHSHEYAIARTSGSVKSHTLSGRTIRGAVASPVPWHYSTTATNTPFQERTKGAGSAIA